MSSAIESYDSDVLVLGGGVAGCMAAASAAERGATVNLVTKGSLTRGGNGYGIIMLTAFPPFEIDIWSPNGERKTWKPDEGKKYLDSIREAAEGLLNEDMTKLFMDRSWDMINRLESYGVAMREPGKQYRAVIVTGHPQILLREPNNLQLRLSQRVLSDKNITAFERTMTVDFLGNHGRVCGAVSFNVRTGAIEVHYAKTVIVATGACFRIYDNPSGIPYNARHSPYNTGDGQAMTLRAGGELVSMEIPLWSACPQHYVVCATSSTSGAGGKWINAKGEVITEKYFQKDAHAPQRYQIAGMLRKEILEGNSPVFLDMTHLPKEYSTYGIEPRVALGYFESRNIDLSKSPLEVTYHAEEALPGQIGGGIRVNTGLETTLENLYAAGEVANSGLVHTGLGAQSCLHGMLAGEYAAAKSKGVTLEKGDETQIQGYSRLIEKKLTKRDAIREAAVAHNLRRIMSTYVQYERNERGLLIALERVSRLKDLLEQVKAANPHELMRFFELRNMIDCGEGIVRSALLRNESRMRPLHHRTDFPNRDDANWYQKLTSIRMENGEMKVRVSRIGG